MGGALNIPKVQKFNDSGNGKKAGETFNYALASMQGWRMDMEDAYHISISLKDYYPLNNWSFFAVFDGHAGCQMAEYASKHLLETLLMTKEIKEVLNEMNDKTVTMNENIINLIQQGISKGFMKLDETMQTLFNGESEHGGTTAICAILTPEYIFLANLGDSRGVLCRKNKEFFGTTDHKPYLTKECERIKNAGGFVLIQRINGVLAVSRSFGDFQYKSVPNLPQNEQIVSADPDIYVIERNALEDEFLVLACDGIFDVLKNEELCELVRSRLAVTHNLSNVTNQLLDICLSKGSRDNMTVFVIVFDSAPQLDPVAIMAEKEWSQKIKNELKSIISLAEDKVNINAEYLYNCLENKNLEFEYSQPAGIHLARSLIHQIVEEMLNGQPTSLSELEEGTANLLNDSEINKVIKSCTEISSLPPSSAPLKQNHSEQGQESQVAPFEDVKPENTSPLLH